MKPLLKWAGGKRHIAGVLENNLPSDWNTGTYFEPFLGGAAFFLHLAPKRAHLSDVNRKLIGFYKEVRDNPIELYSSIEGVARRFDSLPENERKEFFLGLRANFNKSQDSHENSTLFYILNKLCFNGLYRENSKGEFNVPFGQKKRFPSLSKEDFLKVSSGLKGAEIEVSDFESTVAKSVEGDFVYFDPPYVPVNATSSFTTYSAEGFGLSDQRRLAETLSELRERGVKAMLSNSHTPLTSEIFSEFRQIKISAPRMVSANGKARGMIDELLVLNY